MVKLLIVEMVVNFIIPRIRKIIRMHLLIAMLVETQIGTIDFTCIATACSMEKERSFSHETLVSLNPWQAPSRRCDIFLIFDSAFPYARVTSHIHLSHEISNTRSSSDVKILSFENSLVQLTNLVEFFAFVFILT